MSKYKWTINLSVATPMILIASIIISGGGHGFGDQLIVLFPWASVFLQLEIEFLFYFFALIQFPVYGLLCDKAFNKTKTLLMISIIHLLIAGLILFLKHR